MFFSDLRLNESPERGESRRCGLVCPLMESLRIAVARTLSYSKP